MLTNKRNVFLIITIIVSIVAVAATSMVIDQYLFGKRDPEEVVLLSKDKIYVQAKLYAILWKFRVSDAGSIQENYKVAEQILPDAIEQADSDGVRTLSIMAVRRIRVLGFSFDSNYGYVWKKSDDGEWYYQPYQK